MPHIAFPQGFAAAVQPHTPGVPPPPHVAGAVQVSLWLICPVFASHESAVHAFWSSTLTGVWTGPVAGLQVSVVHRSSSERVGGTPGLHLPSVPQVSSPSHALPFEQLVLTFTGW